jgi:hypothetical protein
MLSSLAVIGTPTGASAAGTPLMGTFEITAGVCDTAGVTAGSYFRMIQKNGDPTLGPFVPNTTSSPCGDTTYTPLSPGTDKGLSTAHFQADPKPAFDSSGNATANHITAPQGFFGVNFSTSTNRKDPQTGSNVFRPRISDDGTGKLTGDLRSFSAAWNGLFFNQGAPKPDGSTPGLTAAPTGTYNLATKAYTLDWRSTINGGPFDGFTGVWHLEGTYKPAPALTLHVPGSTRAGARISMNGTVAPSTLGESAAVRVQRRAGDAWKARDRKRAPVGPTGSFAVDHAPLPAGSYRARVEVDETADHAAAAGVWHRFSVTGGSSSAAGAGAPTSFAGGLSSSSSTVLKGTFRIAKGACGASKGIKSGSSFRMVQPGGSPKSGPFVENDNSPCADHTVTPLSPGADGGLRTTGFQPNPKPAFDKKGNALAGRIIRPATWFGVKFSASTNTTDPQTGDAVSRPKIVYDGSGHLKGNVRAFSAAWNKQHFNQGSPKPDGSKPGNTSGPTGTYDPSTGHFVLQWSSQIVGGPFNNFTGVWHLEGTFDGSSSAASNAAPRARLRGRGAW